MSLETLVSADIAKTGRVSEAALAYLSQRAKNVCYDFVMKKFLDSGMTKAELARRLGSRPDRVNHILASPANWTIRTIAELLAAISQEEFIPHSTKLAGRLPRNITQADLLLGIKKQSSTNAETASGSRAHTVKLELAA